jgi:hypothetical protein
MTEYLFNPFWARFRVARHEEIGITGMLVSGEGRSTDVGSFLNPADRESFASAFSRALATVRRTPSDFLPGPRLEDVGRWLEEFHPRSIVELDYQGLAPIVIAEEAGAANSVALTRAALQAIQSGSKDEGLSGLTAIRDRWATVRAFERAN